MAFAVEIHQDTSILDVFAVRRILEPAAAALAASRVGPEDVDDLRAMLGEMDADTAVDDLVAAVLAAPRDAVVEIKALLREAGRRTREAQWAAEREAQARRLRDLTDEGE